MKAHIIRTTNDNGDIVWAIINPLDRTLKYLDIPDFVYDIKVHKEIFPENTWTTVIPHESVETVDFHTKLITFFEGFDIPRTMQLLVSVRAYNVVMNSNLADILQQENPYEYFLSIRHCGKKTAIELVEWITEVKEYLASKS